MTESVMSEVLRKEHRDGCVTHSSLEKPPFLKECGTVPSLKLKWLRRSILRPDRRGHHRLMAARSIFVGAAKLDQTNSVDGILVSDRLEWLRECIEAMRNLLACPP